METKLMFSLPKCFRQAAIPRLLNDITLSYILNMEKHIVKKNVGNKPFIKRNLNNGRHQ